MSLPNYSLVDPGEKGFHEDHWAVFIEDGVLKGLTYQYDTVKIIPEKNEEDGAVLEFNTITLTSPYAKNNLSDDEVRDILGDILVDILKEQIESNNENGTPNPESPAE